MILSKAKAMASRCIMLMLYRPCNNYRIIVCAIAFNYSVRSSCSHTNETVSGDILQRRLMQVGGLTRVTRKHRSRETCWGRARMGGDHQAATAGGLVVGELALLNCRWNVIYCSGRCRPHKQCGRSLVLALLCYSSDAAVRSVCCNQDSNSWRLTRTRSLSSCDASTAVSSATFNPSFPMHYNRSQRWPSG